MSKRAKNKKTHSLFSEPNPTQRRLPSQRKPSLRNELERIQVDQRVPKVLTSCFKNKTLPNQHQLVCSFPPKHTSIRSKLTIQTRPPLPTNHQHLLPPTHHRHHLLSHPPNILLHPTPGQKPQVPFVRRDHDRPCRFVDRPRRGSGRRRSTANGDCYDGFGSREVVGPFGGGGPGVERSVVDRGRGGTVREGGEDGSFFAW